MRDAMIKEQSNAKWRALDKSQSEGEIRSGVLSAG